MEVAVLDFDSFLMAPTTHIGYAALNTEFTLVDDCYKAFFESMKLNKFECMYRCTSMVATTLAYGKTMEKKWRQLLQHYCAYNFTLYVDGDMMDKDNENNRYVLQWAENSLNEKLEDLENTSNRSRNAMDTAFDVLEEMKEMYL